MFGMLIGLAFLFATALTGILRLLFDSELRNDPVGFMFAFMAIGLFFATRYFMAELGHIRAVNEIIIEDKIKALQKKLKRNDFLPNENSFTVETQIKQLEELL